MVSPEPAHDKDAFRCPRCGAIAHQQWDTLQVTTGRFSDRSPRGRSSHWHTATCAHCEESSVWREGRMIFPTSGVVATPHAMMPPHVAELYEEARAVAGVSRRAAAALARATLERLLKHLDTDAGRVTLADRIDRIAAQVSRPLARLLSVLRFVGNDALHGDGASEVLVLVLDEDTTASMELMFQAINDVVDELIARPSEIDALYEALPEGVRARADKAFETGD